MRKTIAATAAIVLVVGLLARDPGYPASWDCGLSGVTPHPEIGGELIYNCALPTTKHGLYLLDVATGIVRVVVADNAWNTDPDWSPDGMRIAYVSTKDGQNDIYVRDLVSGAVTRLTDSGGWNGNPVWSPDGAWIMFDSARDGTSKSPHNNFRNLFLVRPNGADLHRVTALPRYNGQPSWSPDGKRVAFTSDRAASDRDSGYQLYTMNVDGSDQVALVHAESSNARWSPDGSRILFDGHDTPAASGPVVWSLYVISRDSRDLRRLTEGDDVLPDWSPDAKWISFARKVGDGRELFVMPAAGGDAIRLTWDGSDKSWARWRPR